eukprot:TRINITY_DN16861_c0_g1_i4.p1 TRINITY_DN16861_c0_g1~~TRINITY_DN16861_c0_g1_i4.p1  ORF type:complete len:644 (-),score=117.87 TRINITY_DN16861_c0_g1_i4:450-2381(-)
MEPSRDITNGGELLQSGHKHPACSYLREGGHHRNYILISCVLLGCLAAVGIGAHHFTSVVGASAGQDYVVRRLQDGTRVVAVVKGSHLDKTDTDKLNKDVKKDIKGNHEYHKAVDGDISVTETSAEKERYAMPGMIAVATRSNVKSGRKIISVVDVSGLADGMIFKISFDKHSETKQIIHVAEDVAEGRRLSTPLTGRGFVTFDTPLVYAYPRGAVVTAEKSSFTLLGSDRACRIDSRDSTFSGHGTVQKYTDLHSADECKNLCRTKKGCTGVEFQASKGYCEIWTVAIGYTVSKPGFECWRHGQDCVTDLHKFELMWPQAKKIWCCYQEGTGCSVSYHEPDYPAGVGFHWKKDEVMNVVTWQPEKYNCTPESLDKWNNEWTYQQKLWCCKTDELIPPGTDDRKQYCHQDIKPEKSPSTQVKYWQKLGEDGFSFWNVTHEGFHWKKVDGTLVEVPFDCNADLYRFERVWTFDQKKWCCDGLKKGCSDPDKKPIYDAGDGKYWKKEKYEDGSLKGQSWWKPEKVKYRCDADLERFELMWTKDQKKWCCEELGKGCSDCDKEPKYPAGTGFYWECKRKTWERKEAEAADCDQKEKDLTKGLKKWCYDFKHKAFDGEEPPYTPPPQGTRWVKANRDGHFTWELTEG